jgi:hypothetical protein
MKSLTMANLSPLQQSILQWLLTNVRFAEGYNRQLLEVGIDWMPAW